MRDLVKPTALMLSRLSLFLAVVAWLVSQSYVTFLGTPIAGLINDQNGWLFGFDGTAKSRWGFQVRAVLRPPRYEWLFDASTTAHFPEKVSARYSFPGFCCTRIASPLGGTIVAVRHWLVVVIIVMLNAAIVSVQFVRRRRRKRDTGEVT